jgi:hypothetical protein
MSRAHYIDYQDCHYIGRRRTLCSGLNNYRSSANGPVLGLGGFEIIDLKNDQAVYQVPIELWSPSGRPMTQNLFWVEATDSGLKAYFMPDDEKSTLFIYEASSPRRHLAQVLGILRRVRESALCQWDDRLRSEATPADRG